MWANSQENRRMTCGEIAALSNILKMLIVCIPYNKLQLHHVCSKWVPHHLTKEKCKQEITNLVNGNRCFKMILISYSCSNRQWNLGESFWSHCQVCNKHMKTHYFFNSEKNSRNNIDKAMMIILFDHKGVIYHHAVSSKITLNGEYCVSVLKILW